MSKYSVEIKKPAEMTQVEKEIWASLRAENPALYSPYFHFEYTETLGKLRTDVHVLCVFIGGKPVAFLPFQANISANGNVGFARPVGAPMTDYHGFICAPVPQFDVAECLEQAGFGAFHFSALVDTQQVLSRYGRSVSDCTMMDVSEGAQTWRDGCEAGYRRHLKSHRRRVRKSTEIGERKLVFKCRNIAVFDQLMIWKREKFFETGKYDVLSTQWTQTLLRDLWARESKDGLRAEMQVLYFGDQLAAIDLGLTDGETFHSWIVAYNNEFQHLAPGIQLLEELIDASADLGYLRIDLGGGTDGYKRHYASDPIQTASGFIAVRGPSAALSKIYGAAENFGETNLGGVGRIPGKVRRRYAQIRACESSFGGRAKAMAAAVKGAPK